MQDFCSPINKRKAWYFWTISRGKSNWCALLKSCLETKRIGGSCKCEAQSRPHSFLAVFCLWILFFLHGRVAHFLFGWPEIQLLKSCWIIEGGSHYSTAKVSTVQIIHSTLCSNGGIEFNKNAYCLISTNLRLRHLWHGKKITEPPSSVSSLFVIQTPPFYIDFSYLKYETALHFTIFATLISRLML